MDSAFRTYGSALRGACGPGWWVTWPLTTRLQVGDVCTVAGGQPLGVGTLAGLGVPLGADSLATRAGAARDTLTYDGGGAAQVTYKVSGQSPPDFTALGRAEAGAHVRFSRDRAVLVAFRGLTERGLREARTLARPLAKLYFEGEWEPDWVAVTHVVAAESGTVLVAARQGAEAELRVDAHLDAGPQRLADLAVGVSLARQSSLGLDWTGRACTPFCRMVRLTRSWLGQVDADYAPRQKVKGLAPPTVPPLVLERAAAEPDAVVEDVPVAGDEPAGDRG